MRGRKNIIIIKSEPRIDLLRSTCLLEPLKNRYPSSAITWVCARRNRILLKNNPLIDNLLFIEEAGILCLGLNLEFECALNLDQGITAGCVINLLQAKDKYGIAINRQGDRFPLTAEAEPLLGYEYEREKFSRETALTYQSLVMKATGMGTEPVGRMIFNLSPSDKDLISDFISENNLATAANPKAMIYMGFNPETGRRYLSPKSASFIAEDLYEKMGIIAILVAGPREKEWYQKCIVQCPPETVEGGCNHSFSRFCALLDYADLVIAPDSLGLHISLSLGKKVIALLPPEQKPDFELYGCGVALNCSYADGELWIKSEEVLAAVQDITKK